MTIKILDGRGKFVAHIKTDRPQWSFDQYCRNRDASNWTWASE